MWRKAGKQEQDRNQRLTEHKWKFLEKHLLCEGFMLWQNYGPLLLKHIRGRHRPNRRCKTVVSPQVFCAGRHGADQNGCAEGLRGRAFPRGHTEIKTMGLKHQSRSSNVSWLLQLNGWLCRATGCLHPNIKEKKKKKNLVSSQKAPTLEFPHCPWLTPNRCCSASKPQHF